MSKELEALERIGQFKNSRDFILKTDNGEDKEWHFETIRELFPDEFDTIKNALKRLETLEEEKQSFDRHLEKKLKTLEILSEHIIINEKRGYVEFQCDFSLPTNSKYENEEHFKEKINLLKEVLL